MRRLKVGLFFSHSYHGRAGSRHQQAGHPFYFSTFLLFYFSKSFFTILSFYFSSWRSVFLFLTMVAGIFAGTSDVMGMPPQPARAGHTGLHVAPTGRKVNFYLAIKQAIPIFLWRYSPVGAIAPKLKQHSPIGTVRAVSYKKRAARTGAYSRTLQRVCHNIGPPTKGSSRYLIFTFPRTRWSRQCLPTG